MPPPQPDGQSLESLWTPEQLRAIEWSDGIVSVDAGAGSGKTGVIVARFVNIVATKLAAADEILAITYTNKAAQEMKRRIVRTFESRGMREERRQAEHSYIHTIHGLCRRILAENPFEAGIDPAFAVVAASNAHATWKAAFDVCVRTALDTEGSMKRLIGTSPALPVFGSNPHDLLHALQTAVRGITDQLRSYGMTHLDVLAWADTIEPDAQNDFLPEVSRFREKLERKISEVAADCSPEVHRVADEFANLLKMVDPGSPMESWHQSAQETIERLKATARANRAHPVIRAASDVAIELKNLNTQNERDAATLGAAMLRLVGQTWAKYEREKMGRACMDFEDLQQRTLELLRGDGSARERYRQRFRYILVDEFQDINPVQKEIIDELRGDRNLMFVGDEHQSIYGFRFSDVDFLRRETARVKATEQAGLEGAAAISLHTNFRSREPILEFVDLVFRKVWPEKYQRLDTGRATSENPGSAVEIMVADERSGRYEPQAIARLIRRRVLEGTMTVFDAERNEERPVRYGDFAVLLRTFGGVNEYERTFAEHGVPFFVVGGGRNYYARNEVRDLMNLLRALHLPQDELALACLLRSPMVGVSLDCLVLVTATASEGGLHTALQRLPEAVSQADRAKIIAMLEWFSPLARVADRFTVATILERVIAMTNYDAKLLCRENGVQRLANVRKLIQMSMEAPDITLDQFATRLDTLEKVMQREGDAPTHDEFADVVRLVTVHTAKGLEYPVVVLSDLAWSPPKRNKSVELDVPNRRIGLKWRKIHSVAHRDIGEAQRAREIEEEARVLYVAMTRARDHLLVVMPSQLRPDSWASRLTQAIEIRPATVNDTRPVPGRPYVFIRPESVREGPA